MATKEIKRRKQRMPGIVPGSPSSKVNDDEDEDDIKESRRANREKQLRLNQQRQRTSK